MWDFSSCDMHTQIGLVSSFLSNRRLWVVLDGKTYKEYPVNDGVPLFLVLHFSCNTLMTFLMMLSVILLVVLMILHSTLSVIGICFVATTNVGF